MHNLFYANLSFFGLIGAEIFSETIRSAPTQRNLPQNSKNVIALQFPGFNTPSDSAALRTDLARRQKKEFLHRA